MTTTKINPLKGPYRPPMRALPWLLFVALMLLSLLDHFILTARIDQLSRALSQDACARCGALLDSNSDTGEMFIDQ